MTRFWSRLRFTWICACYSFADIGRLLIKYRLQLRLLTAAIFGLRLLVWLVRRAF